MTIKSRKFTSSISLTASCSLCLSIASAQSIWTGAGADNNFTNADNWDNNTPPSPGGNSGTIPDGFDIGAGDEVNLNQPLPGVRTFDVDNYDLTVNGNSDLRADRILRISDGGSLTLNGTSSLIAGQNPLAGSNIFNDVVDGGQLTINENASVSFDARNLRVNGAGSIITLNGGSLTNQNESPNFTMSGQSQYLQNGGTLTTNNMTIGGGANGGRAVFSSGTADVTNGINFGSSYTNGIGALVQGDAVINAGDIVSDGGAGTFQQTGGDINLNSMQWNTSTATYDLDGGTLDTTGGITQRGGDFDISGGDLTVGGDWTVRSSTAETTQSGGTVTMGNTGRLIDSCESFALCLSA